MYKLPSIQQRLVGLRDLTWVTGTTAEEAAEAVVTAMVVDVGRVATEEDATAVEVLVATTVAVVVLVGLELAGATAEEVARTEVEVARTEVEVARTEVDDGSSEVAGRAVWETVAQMLEPTTEAAIIWRQLDLLPVLRADVRSL